jgi:hypothetical protein
MEKKFRVVSVAQTSDEEVVNVGFRAEDQPIQPHPHDPESGYILRGEFTLPYPAEDQPRVGTVVTFSIVED